MVISNSSSSFTSFISIALISTQVEYEQLHATLPLLELQAEDGATREELEMSLDSLMEVNCFKQFFNLHNLFLLLPQALTKDKPLTI